VPNTIITDNKTNFTGKKFLEFADGYGIRIDCPLEEHPRTNGQVERTNGMVLQGHKPRIFNWLKEFDGRWVEELQVVLWILKITPNRSTRFTPFFLTYGAEAVLLSNLDYGAPRVKAFDPNRAAEAQQDMVDLLEEAWETALVRSACYQQTLRRHHKSKIWGKTLEVSDLVLRRAQSTKDRQKLTPIWEGPYTIMEVIRPGTYILKDSDSNILANTWNVEQLRHFFP
jgi:hypothetical protein